METVVTTLDFIDRYMVRAAAKSASQGRPIRCAAGCYFCCKEPVWAERSEVVHLVAHCPEDLRPALVEKTRAWWEAFFGGGHEAAPPPREIVGTAMLTRYRAANLWCPLLKDGLCTVYAQRPAGCRMHAAVGNPQDCADDVRRLRQVFMVPDDETSRAVGRGLVAGLIGEAPHAHLRFDHLGVWLGHLLLGKTERSAGGEDMAIMIDPGPVPLSP